MALKQALAEQELKEDTLCTLYLALSKIPSRTHRCSGLSTAFIRGGQFPPSTITETVARANVGSFLAVNEKGTRPGMYTSGIPLHSVVRVLADYTARGRKTQ